MVTAGHWITQSTPSIMSTRSSPSRNCRDCTQQTPEIRPRCLLRQHRCPPPLPSAPSSSVNDVSPPPFMSATVVAHQQNRGMSAPAMACR
ncbi:hypothetical protein ACLOJK_041083 [Asimina triloba]